jgi:hypothetical protein
LDQPDVTKTLREILAVRIIRSAPYIVRELTESAIQHALISVDVAELVHVLAANLVETADSRLPPEAHRLNPESNVDLRRALAKVAGGLLDAEQARQRMGYASKSEVYRAHKEKRLLAVRHAGRQKYPAFQFELGAELGALTALLNSAPDASGWQILQHIFTTKDGKLSDQPINLVSR